MTDAFSRVFAERRKRALGRLRLRGSLTGLCVSAVTLPLALLWQRLAPHGLAEWPVQLPWALALAVLLVGAAAGALVAHLRRPSDESLALLFDFELGGRQQIPLALELEPSSVLGRHVRAEATALLERAQAKRTLELPRLWQRKHWLLPLWVVSAALALGLPFPEAPPTLTPPGAQLLQLQTLDELSDLAALRELPGLSEPERRRLSDLGERAQRLQQRLAEGLPQREALAEVARLQSTLTAELAALGAGSEPAGLEAAVRVLQGGSDTLRAADALGTFDLSRLDDEMRRLSSSEERVARQRARQSLEHARDAASAVGAPNVSRVLNEQLRSFDEREATARQLRDLLRELGARTPSEPATEAPNAESAEPPRGRDRKPEGTEAAESASPERLAERLLDGLERGEMDFRPPPGAALEPSAQMDGEQVRQQLASRLNQLQTPSPRARHQQALSSAARGLGRLERTLAGRSTPLPRPHSGPAGNTPAQARDTGAPSSGPGGSRGQHAGRTAEVDGSELRAKTEQALDPRRGRTSLSSGRTLGRSGTAAAPPRTDDVRAAGPEQLEGMERAAIPQEYREQVSRYFSLD